MRILWFIHLLILNQLKLKFLILSGFCNIFTYLNSLILIFRGRCPFKSLIAHYLSLRRCQMAGNIALVWGSELSSTFWILLARPLTLSVIVFLSSLRRNVALLEEICSKQEPVNDSIATQSVHKAVLLNFIHL